MAEQWGAPGAGQDRPQGGGAEAVSQRLLEAWITEQRRSRRWGIFFKSLFAVYFLALLWVMGDWGRQDPVSGPHVALVRLEGMILEEGSGNAQSAITGLRRAFESDVVSGVILQINSPGGSPVQAHYIYEEIRRLKDEYPGKPVYAVATDMCASGGYYVAVAADAIYASGSSIIGSIGVRMDSFGFTEAIRRLGIERRLYTAGDNKGFLDPFQEEKQDEIRHLQTVLDNIHEQFVTAVRTGRGDRLAEDPTLFGGLFWSGEQSVELGLIDGLGSVRSVVQERLDGQRLVDYTVRPALLERFSRQVGVTLAEVLESRLGLTLSAPR